MAVSPASGRTIELTDLDCELMAAIHEEAPLLSWAGGGANGVYGNFTLDFDSRGQRDRQAFLIQFPLQNRIPEGMRIVRAELIVPLATVYPEELQPRLALRRLEASWGIGVCYLYRQQLPEVLPWAEPGALAPGKDRARRPSAVVRTKTIGDLSIDVTQDVEIWNAGLMANYGWILELDEDSALVRMYSPPWSPGTWKLRITFEPR